MTVFLAGSIWIDLIFMKMVFGKQTIQMMPEKFLATPGEFPYAVVMFKGGEMFAGVLVTEDIILSTCKQLMDIIPQRISQSLMHTTTLKAIGSNGDWMHDPGRVLGRSDFVYFGQDCVKVTEEYQVLLGAAVLQRGFTKSPYVDSVQNRAVMKNAEEWKTIIMKLLKNANCYEKNRNVCKKREFVIGGYMVSAGKNSQDSPMFRVVTHLLGDNDCYELICKNISCRTFSMEALQSTGTLCFPTIEIGGPGSPVAFGRIVVGVGNFVKDDHLIATRFDVGYSIVESLISTALQTSRLSSILAGLCLLTAGNAMSD